MAIYKHSGQNQMMPIANTNLSAKTAIRLSKQSNKQISIQTTQQNLAEITYKKEKSPKNPFKNYIYLS